MTYKELKAYMELCRYYGWKATWEGIRAFKRGDRARMLGGIRR